MADVFISYAREDLDTVARLARLLEGQGMSVWWDPRLSAGEVFSEVIQRELAEARVAIVAWSGDSVKSAWVRDEAREAAEQGKLVPVSLDGVMPPLGFREIQTIDLQPWLKRRDPAPESKLLAAVGKLLAAGGGYASRLPDGRAEGMAVPAPSLDFWRLLSPWLAWRPVQLLLLALAALLIGGLVLQSRQAAREPFQPIRFREHARPSFSCSEYREMGRDHQLRIPQSDVLCHSERAADADRRMGDTYRTLRAKLSEAERQVLKDEQQAWQTLRNQRCPARWGDLASRGQVHRAFVDSLASCLEAETDERSRALEERLRALMLAPAPPASASRLQ